VRALLPILAAIALAGSACGGDAVALDPVAKAATATSGQTSEHVVMTGSVTGPTGERLTLTGSGDFQNDPQLGTLTMTIGAGSKALAMTEVIKDWRMYMTSPLFSGLLPAGKTWMSLDLHSAGKRLGIDFSSYTGQTPSQTLEQLKAAGQVVRVGPATIGGVATTHYRATIDVSKIPNGKKLAQMAGLTYKPVDVYIDKAGLLRRIQMGYSSTVGGTASMTMDYSNYGEAVNVAVPDDSVTYDVTDETNKALKSFGG
jgi:hypothetical protein